ncbi:MAG TPA: glycosyltransferase family 4 protein [Burkholderiales bacterium]|nr:glycosyltransferase family 4 protein [Burkholderiales bacterium]
MKIAQIAPLAESVPPKLYGGTERVVAYLTEELVRLGHDVTLFASGDSDTSARLVACSPRALRLDPTVKDPLAPTALMIERVRQRANEFDILHFHTDPVHFPVFRPMARKTVTTMHSRLDAPELVELYREFSDMPLVSISNSQRKPLPFANWIGTVYHGLAREVCPFNPAFKHPSRGGYYAFLGRVSPEKGLERAIEIARRAGARLRIAAKIDPADEEYFNARITPLLAAPDIEFIGELNEAQKPAFLGNALALLFPIAWPEPFGLAMIEAMSCGTPIIAFRHGSVPEVVEDGRTGFIVDSIEEAVAALGKAARLDRAFVRQRFEERFSAARMAQDYLAAYRALGRRRAAVAA